MCRVMLLRDNTLLQGNKNLGPRIGSPHEPEDHQPYWESLGLQSTGVPVNRCPVSTGSGVPRLGGTRALFMTSPAPTGRHGGDQSTGVVGRKRTR